MKLSSIRGYYSIIITSKSEMKRIKKLMLLAGWDMCRWNPFYDEHPRVAIAVSSNSFTTIYEVIGDYNNLISPFSDKKINSNEIS